MREEKHTRERLFITLGYLSPLFQCVREKGKPLEPMLSLVGITEEDLSCSDIRLPDSVIDELNVCAERLCQDKNIGLHAGQRMGLNNIGIIGHLMMTCTQTSQILSLHSRYQTLIGNGAMSEYKVNLDKVCLHFRRADGGKPYQRHAYEFSLAGWMSLVKLISGQSIKPDLIEFPCEPPQDLSEQRTFFACELRYAAGSEMRVHFSRHHLEHTLLAGDSSLREALEVAARQRLVELQGSYSNASDSLVNRAAGFVRESLIHGPPSIEAAAAHLDTSVRTLQRQLGAEAVTYKDLVDKARRELCERYIQNHDLTLVDVALMLGFSEQSSFQRAFKRWFKITPGEYRRDC